MRFPTKQDIKRILNLHLTKHKVPGLLGSLDVSHVRWKNCPKAFHGQYQGRSQKPTVALEAISDYHLWFWHASFGYPGTLNDINVLNVSTLLDKLTDNHLLTECEAEFGPYTIGDKEFEQFYFLVDGIYPPWARFLKTLSVPLSQKQFTFSKWQEASRKDIERAFGQLQQVFHIVANPVNTMRMERFGNIMTSCLILHNMRVEEYVSGHEKYKPDDGCDMNAIDGYRGANSVVPLIINEPDADPNSWLNRYAAEWKKLTDVNQHKRLQDAVMDLIE